MQYLSSRNAERAVTAAEAIAAGLSPDGGLYTPASLPEVAEETLRAMCGMDYQARAVAIMKLFLDAFDEQELQAFAQAAYNCHGYDDARIAPLHVTERGTAFLELWHGPTCAFKDMALQMLPHLLTASLRKIGEKSEVCILVATSGDTGKAALEGFRDVAGTRILVFYPRDGVSDVQKLQMTTQEGNNVGVCGVLGNFDDAQSGVKSIFADASLREQLRQKHLMLSSANSINWGRLLPQIVYYFSAYCDMVRAGELQMGDPLHFCVPTGNFGNILAGYIARCMGLPVGKLICASNANNVLTDFLHTGVYDKNRTLQLTCSPSMDILISSNLERLLFLASGMDAQLVATCMQQLAGEGKYAIEPALKAKLDAVFAAGFCDDAATKRAIRREYDRHGYLIDTHTAVALDVLEQYRAHSGDTAPAVIVSTASPYKFCDSVLEALGEPTDAHGLELITRLAERTGTTIPAPLASLKGKPVRFTGYCEKSGMRAAVMEMLGL